MGHGEPCPDEPIAKQNRGLSKDNSAMKVDSGNPHNIAMSWQDWEELSYQRCQERVEPWIQRVRSYFGWGHRVGLGVILLPPLLPKGSCWVSWIVTKHSLETLVASTMNNLQPRVGENVKDLVAMNLWFKELENKLNLSLGALLVSLSSTTDLIKLDQLEPPFLGRNKSSLTLCLFENDCGDLLQVPGILKNDLNTAKLNSKWC